VLLVEKIPSKVDRSLPLTPHDMQQEFMWLPEWATEILVQLVMPLAVVKPLRLFFVETMAPKTGLSDGRLPQK